MSKIVDKFHDLLEYNKIKPFSGHIPYEDTLIIGTKTNDDMSEDEVLISILIGI